MENPFYCYSNTDGIGFGSDPHFGLFIDSSLKNGSSRPCKTFANSQLSSTPHFDIKELEVYGFLN